MDDHKFVKELSDDYYCMICAKVLKEPHLTDCCGQHFCQACLEQWFKKQQKKICPHCRSENFSHMRYLPLKRKINFLEVYCPYQNEGCEVVTQLGELNIHKDECGFAKVVCSQGCGRLICRKDLAEHCSNECLKRMIKCKYCGKEDHFETINDEHMTVCDECPVNCPWECNLADGIKRKNLVKHMEICPLEKVQCPFHDAGCDVMVLRKDLNGHIESSMQTHLMKVMSAYSKLKKDFKTMSSQAILAEPIIKLSLGSTIYFSLTSSKGWVTPPFYVLDRYKFCIRHKRDEIASLVLLKKVDNLELQLPTAVVDDLNRYELEVRLEKSTYPTYGLSQHPSIVSGCVPSSNPCVSTPVPLPDRHPLNSIKLSTARVSLGRIIGLHSCGEEVDVVLASGLDKLLLNNAVLSVKLRQLLSVCKPARKAFNYCNN